MWIREGTIILSDVLRTRNESFLHRQIGQTQNNFAIHPKSHIISKPKNKIMKKLHLQMKVIILICLFSQSLFAQDSETVKIKELYLSGNLLTFNNFGLQYKSELKNGNFFRIGVTDISTHLTKRNDYPQSAALPSTSTQFVGSFEIGLEKRAHITNKLTAFYGVNIVIATSFQRSKTEDPTLPLDLRHIDNFSINPGLGFNSGFIYRINDEFSVSAELIPRLLYNYNSSQGISGLTKASDISQGVSFNLDNQSARVSLIYHWNSK